jgi:hypothetical protein
MDTPFKIRAAGEKNSTASMIPELIQGELLRPIYNMVK